MPGYKRKLQPGSIPKIWKDTGEGLTISENPVGNPSEPSRNQVKRIARKQQVSHLKTERKIQLELNTAYNRNKTDNVLGK